MYETRYVVTNPDTPDAVAHRVIYAIGRGGGLEREPFKKESCNIDQVKSKRNYKQFPSGVRRCGRCLKQVFPT
jgi:hypothetical protein